VAANWATNGRPSRELDVTAGLRVPSARRQHIDPESAGGVREGDDEPVAVSTVAEHGRAVAADIACEQCRGRRLRVLAREDADVVALPGRVQRRDGPFGRDGCRVRQADVGVGGRDHRQTGAVGDRDLAVWSPTR
jgi:hypothetical protein